MHSYRLILAVAVIAILAVGADLASRSAVQPSAPSLPLDLKNLMPASWEIIPGKYLQCDFEDSPAGNPQWLVLYRYDKTSGDDEGSIGGIVFATEANSQPQQAGATSPYQPVLLVPYRLLPDINGGKGQGYLGGRDATIDLYPAQMPGQPCKAQEITIFGYDAGSEPTRLSIFRWDPDAHSYQGVNFVGDAHVSATWNVERPQPITHVLTYNRADDRSSLCVVRGYNLPPRSGSGQVALAAEENPDDYTIDFCSGAPADPFYPEAVVVALLRGADPPAAGSPTGASYLIPGALDAAVSDLPDLAAFRNGGRAAARILTVVNPGALGPSSAPGRPFPTPSSATGSDSWWQSGQPADVRTIFVLNGMQHDVTWHLVNLADQSIAADSHWRVQSVSVQ